MKSEEPIIQRFWHKSRNRRIRHEFIVTLHIRIEFDTQNTHKEPVSPSPNMCGSCRKSIIVRHNKMYYLEARVIHCGVDSLVRSVYEVNQGRSM